MPNGGSDCCGTCPFNRKNHGEAGYAHVRDPGPDYCEIRGLDVEISFYTYCANHPGHNPDRTRVPIGPVYRHGETYGREVWQPAPDSTEARGEMLRILAAATPEPIEDYPAGVSLVEAAIIHAGDLCDGRFIPDLDRIRTFPGLDDDPAHREQHRFLRDPARAAAFAVRALAQIVPPAAIQPFATDDVRAIAATVEQTGDCSGLGILADALQDAGCEHAVALDYLRIPTGRLPNWVVDLVLGRHGEEHSQLQ